jgi:hypothetical protein
MNRLRICRLAFALLVTALWACESAHAAASCSEAVAAASRVNASALFEGATACAQEGQQEDTNYLMILGQIRSLADLAIFVPLDDENAEKAGRLYALVYYKFGGLGFEEVYRTPANVSALEKRIREADLSITGGYDPGWSYRPSSKTDLYAQVVSDTREKRLWQMRNMALKFQNDEYYEAHRAQSELMRNNRVFREGTPAYEEQARLAARMNEIARTIPELPPPQDTFPYARMNEQDPELAKRQVAAGFNGPASSGAYVFRSEADVRRSWLAAALPKQELDTLISRTDFSKQVLVAYSFGRRENASSQIILSELRYHRNQGYTISTTIGVVPESCGVPFADSYPFVVGVTDAVAGAEITATGTSNFPVECGPIVSSKPTTDQ